MSEISRFIDNDVPDLDARQSYAAIIGANPSAGARSPLLWNAAFRELGMDCEMVPMDVEGERLEALLAELEKDSRFIGGAVAVPHKEPIARWISNRGLGGLSPEAKAIGTVNCLHRGENGALCATNTDGEGALVSLQLLRPDLQGSRVLLIGPGGAGKAVAAFLGTAVGDSGHLTVSARRRESVTEFADGIDASVTAWPPNEQVIRNTDILVNCTTIGSKQQVKVKSRTVNLINYSPLAALDEDNIAENKRLLNVAPDDILVFDIIYDPSPTKLLELAEERGAEILDGGMMNLEQAVLAFQYAAGVFGQAEQVRTIMQKAKASL